MITISEALAFFKMEEYQNELRGHLLNPRVSSDISEEVEKAKEDNRDLVRELRAHFQVDSVEYVVAHDMPF